tara:strand:+ start:218 stop:553 length:336 start_codon:yes stop_codon:yes gene_type:complete
MSKETERIKNKVVRSQFYDLKEAKDYVDTLIDFDCHYHFDDLVEDIENFNAMTKASSDLINERTGDAIRAFKEEDSCIFEYLMLATDDFTCSDKREENTSKFIKTLNKLTK